MIPLRLGAVRKFWCLRVYIAAGDHDAKECHGSSLHSSKLDLMCQYMRVEFHYLWTIKQLSGLFNSVNKSRSDYGGICSSIASIGKF